MRTLTLISAIGLWCGLSAQPYFAVDTIIRCDTAMTVEALQSKGRKWFATTFKDANEVIQMDDLASGTIIGKGISRLGTYDHMEYTVEVNFRPGRARFRINEVRHRWNDPSSTLHWGALLDSTHCYTPPIVPMVGAKAANKQMLKNCSEYVPLVRSKLSGLTLSFAKVVTSDGSDW